MIGGITVCSGGNLIFEGFLCVTSEIWHCRYDNGVCVSEVQLKVVDNRLISFVSGLDRNEKHLRDGSSNLEGASHWLEIGKRWKGITVLEIGEIVKSVTFGVQEGSGVKLKVVVATCHR